jgi:hypothetical protein
MRPPFIGSLGSSPWLKSALTALRLLSFCTLICSPVLARSKLLNNSNSLFPHNSTQRADQRGACFAKFCPVMQRKLTQYSFSFDSQQYQNFASVLVSTLATHVPTSGKPVHQFDGAVMLDLKPFGQLPNARSKIWGEALQCQHELMLMRIESRGANRLLAEVREESNLMTQFGKRPIIASCECGSQAHSLPFHLQC